MAMGQIFAPIIAITLVLLSVFVPVAFIPGISGELFRQFAVTVAVSMFLSAINALTLSPALCALLLQAPSRPASRSDRRAHARHRLGARRLWRQSSPASCAFPSSACRGGRRVDGRRRVAWARSRRPAFCRKTTRAHSSSSSSLPDGASIGRTTDVVQQVERRAEAGGVDRGLLLRPSA